MSDHYFDHNATTPLYPAAREAWLGAAERHWHNASSLYPGAGAARIALEDARTQVAELVGAAEETEIIFTSGATEANNAVFSHYARQRPGKACAVSAIEHPSVLEPARRHFGDALLEIPVDADGCVDLDHLAGAISSKDIGLVSVMAANNETGVLQPLAGVSRLCSESGALFHCDAVQWFGKQAEAIHADIVVASGHKFGAPKGVGFVRICAAADDFRLQTGGPQEERRRAGTEDLPGIAAMSAALEAAVDPTPQEFLRDSFERDIAKRIPGTRPLATAAKRLPNTSMLVMPAGKNLKWLTRLGRRGFSISTGSACSSGAQSGSHVLAAMGLAAGEIDRALRISSGPQQSPEDWRALTDAMVEVAQGIEQRDSS